MKNRLNGLKYAALAALAMGFALGARADAVAKIIGMEGTYDTVQEAIDAAADNQTVQMLADSLENVTIAEGKAITLDLAGKVLNSAANGKSVIKVDGGLTLVDSAPTATHTDEYELLPPGGVITGGKFKNPSGLLGGGVCNLGTFTMLGGTIIGNEVGGMFPKAGCGGGVHNSGIMTVGGTASIRGNLRAGAVDNLYLTLGRTVSVGTGDAAPKAGMAIGISVEATIASGEALAVTGANAADYHGYFSSDNSAYGVFDGTEHAVTLNNTDAAKNATTGVDYATVQAAVDAASDGDTVQLLRDASGNVSVIGKAITLDLNGKELSAYSGSVITLGDDNNAGTLTLIDGTAVAPETVGAGRITSAPGGTGARGVWVAKSGTFYLTSGRISGCYVIGEFGDPAASGGGVYSEGSVIMTGGAIENCRASNSGGGIDSWNALTMSGGVIRGCSALCGGGIVSAAVLNLGGTAVITNNSASLEGASGGGVYYSLEMTLSGSVVITDNTNGISGLPDNLFLRKRLLDQPGCYTFAVADGFDGTIGVTSEVTPTKEEPLAFATNVVDAAVAKRFFSDDAQYAVSHTDGNELQLVVPEPVARSVKTDGGSSVTNDHAAITDAINAIGANGTGTVTMLRDVTLMQEGSGTLPNGIDLAFDLAGKKIDWTTTNGDALFYFASGSTGKLTIVDSGSGGTISSTCTSADTMDSALIVFCDGNGDLTVNGGTFVCSNKVGAATHFFKRGTGTWTFNGGTYKALGEGAGGAHFLYCAAATGTTRITGGMYDIRATASGAAGIAASEECLDRITITGGDFDVVSAGSWHGAFTSGNGSLLITGGDFSLTGTGEGIACIAAERGGTVTISNGTFYAETTDGYVYAASAADTSELLVAGGTFSAKGSTKTAASVIGKGHSKLTIVGTPDIRQATGSGWRLSVEIHPATFDFSGYTGATLAAIAVFPDDTYGVPYVTGDIRTKFNSVSIWAGYFSTRPYDWAVVPQDRGVFANTDEETKTAYPWVIDDTVTFTPATIDNTAAVVYTNGAAMTAAASYTLRINAANATVAYSAANGYYFGSDGRTAVTNALDTTKNPATAETPAAPFEAVASVTTNGVTAVYGTLPDAWVDATNAQHKSVNACVKLLSDATVATTLRTSDNGVLTLDLNDHVLAYVGMNNESIIHRWASTLHVVDTAQTRTPRYFTCDGTGLWTLTNEVTERVVMGGLLTGGRAGAITHQYGVSGGPHSISNVNFVGNWSGSNGGAVSTPTSGMVLEIAASSFLGNVAVTNGGAISAAGLCEMTDCRVEANVAGGLGGGVYMRLKGSLVGTEVVGNVAGTGGGVYLTYSSGGCFPAGVKILLADGAEKKVEDIVKGDVVATFDHVGGTNSSAAVFSIYRGTEPLQTFALSFASGATLEVADCHDLLLETTRKYVTISSDNARQFVGRRFYNYATGRWDELTGVTAAKGSEAHYSLYTRGHGNCVANGMLTVPDDKDCFINVYELEENLKADAEQLAADVATYGLATTADYPNVPPDEFAAHNMRYARIAIGKGLTTQERILYWNEFDYGPVAQETQVSAPKLTMSAAPMMLTSSPSAVPADRHLSVGEGVVVTGNVTSAGSASNVYLDRNRSAIIDILPDTANLDVGVTLSNGADVFGFANDVNYSSSFTPDDPQYVVFYNAAHELALAIPVAYTEPAYVTEGDPASGIAYWTTNTVCDYTVVGSSASAVTWGESGATNWYVVKDAEVQIDGGVTCAGRVNLILCDGAKLLVTEEVNWKAGIETDENGSFTIYGQPNGAGELAAASGSNNDAAGIGGGACRSGMNITINGGKVTAFGGTFGAGIGGGFDQNEEKGGLGSNIVINAGVVTAVGGMASAGIGGSNVNDGMGIVINGGIVTVRGGENGGGIGGGQFGRGEDIVINSGTVFVATESSGNDLIGSGEGAAVSSGVRISSAANVFFDLTDGGQGLTALPAFEGMVIYTPDPAVARTLVGGVADGALGDRPLPFVLMKAGQERTKPIVVNGAAVPFASKVLSLTHAANKLSLGVGDLPDEPIVKDDQGNDVEIVVPQEWREKKGVSDEDAVDPKNPNDNGMPTWQSYALGLDPTNRCSGIYADTPQNAETDTVTIVTKNLDTQKLVDGFSVKYRLDTMLRGTNEYTKGVTQESASFDVKIDKADPTGVSKLNAVIFSNGVEIAQSAEAVNIVGLIRQTQVVSNAIVSVPWDKLAPGEVGEIAVSNVVKTANLSTNDELRVYRPGQATYESWVLDSNKVWVAATTVKVAAKGGALGDRPLPNVTMSVADEAEAATIPRGSGIWLCRKSNFDRPYYLYGQANGLDDSEVALEQGPNLVGATGLGEYDLNAHVTGAMEGDRIQVPGDGPAPTIYEYKDGKWGTYESVPTEVVFQGETNTTFKNVWTTERSKVKPGTGFWLYNNSGAVEVK